MSSFLTAHQHIKGYFVPSRLFLQKRKVFSFFLKVVMLLVERMLTGRLFHAHEADTLNARSLIFDIQCHCVFT